MKIKFIVSNMLILLVILVAACGAPAVPEATPDPVLDLPTVTEASTDDSPVGTAITHTDISVFRP